MNTFLGGILQKIWQNKHVTKENRWSAQDPRLDVMKVNL